MTLHFRHTTRVVSAALSIAIVLATVAQAQTDKIDSLLLHLRLPRDRAVDAVVAAFAQAGLGVTNTTGSLVEADQGTTQSLSIKTRRTVRAVLFGSDSITTVLITGDEVRTDAEYGTLLRRLRIDNHAGGNGGKVWKKIIAAARTLDSASVPTAALPEE